MEDEVQCSRGSRDDRSERAPSRSLPCSERCKPYPARRAGPPLGNARGGLRRRQHVFTGARRRSRSWQGEGSTQGPSDRALTIKQLIGQAIDQGAPRRDRLPKGSREGVWQRSRSRSRSSRSPAVVVESRSPRARSSVARGTRPRGVRESVARSRPAEPGASRYPVSARIDSSFACLDSWHRAPLLAEEEARAGTRTEGVDALLVRMHVRNGCGSHPKNPKAKTSEWVAVTASRHFSREGAGKLACRRDSARERVRCRPYPGRHRACSASQVASL
jgi:hypothetical protein